ncbi:MAG TPA: M20/M25/M40 family metallo-hydrolase [Peptococcaceae bacterium]|nr:M20/M25/M40 family metallo-hydrolase [Peptococcaceae bacterium]
MPINVVEEFLELVKYNSPSKKEGKIAAYLQKRLQDLGAEVHEDDSSAKTGSDTGNIIALYPGDKAKPTVLLAAHMDTVAQKEGMVPKVRDGVIYSDGSTILGADDKAGIAVILSVLSILKENKNISHGPIEVLFTVQEEVGLVGVKHLDYNLCSQYGYVLDGDGPVGTIVNASPSHITLDIVVEGKAAHAGLAPETGINAIVVAAEAIAAIPSGRLDEETTSNFGLIRGGQGRNIVAERVEVSAEVRSRNKEKLAQETARVIRSFEEAVAKYQAKVNIVKELAYEAFNIDPAHPVIANALRAGEKLGIDVKLHATGGGLDANILNARGITCVALGLGNGNPHSKDEYQEIAELERAVQFILNILTSA